MSFPRAHRATSWLFVLALPVMPALACSSKTVVQSAPPGSNPGDDGGSMTNPMPSATGTSQDPGLMPGQMPQGHDTNPYGVAYPTKGLGFKVRAGSVPGNVIQNY